MEQLGTSSAGTVCAGSHSRQEPVQKSGRCTRQLSVAPIGWLAVLASLVALGLPAVRGNTILKRTIGQQTACVNALNSITITLQVQNKVYRSWDGFKELEPTASVLQISKLVQTKSPDTTALPVVDLQRASSKTAIIAQEVSRTSNAISVDNAFRAGLEVDATIQVDQEVVKILQIAGPGCRRSHFVHSGCWNTMTVARAQHGTEKGTHKAGTLTYSVTVASLMDSQKLEDGSPGLGNANEWINVDHHDGFEVTIDDNNARYVQINKEIARIEQRLDLNGTVGTGDAFSFLLPEHFSDVDNYYNGIDIVFFDDVEPTGEGWQDVVLQRRKIVAYTGFTRLVRFTEEMDPLPVPGKTRFHMKAIKLLRGQYDTGTISVTGAPPNILVTYLGQIHRQLSQIYYLQDSWTVLYEEATWTKNDGKVLGRFFADTIPGQTMHMSLPLTNPSIPQSPQNVTISVDGTAGVQTATETLLWDYETRNPKHNTTWPLVFPLFICFEGTWMASGEITCRDCVIGKFTEACGGSECFPCNATTYTSAPRQTACKDCEIGYFCVGDSDRSPCPPGKFSEAKSSTCQDCNLGHFCPGAAYQSKCLPGEFMNVTGATACLDCAAGSYSHALGAWNCTLCGNGTFSGPGQSVCTDCAPGKYVLGEGNTECKFCEKSKYQPTVANTECLQCPRNTGAREISGVCTGACKGSTTKDDCLCKPGFTRFGQTSDECTAFDFNVANMGQSTACPSKNNIIGVTLQTNAELTTAVQEIAVVSAGKGYADATLDVVEPGGVGFSGKAITRPVDGSISGVEIVDGGAQFTGFPEAVNIYFSPGCAEIDDACTSTKQEGTIARIQIVNPGSGYIQGRVNISGGGGTGATADFVTDAVGVITSVRFADVASHGQGYSSPAALALLYPMAARCDKLKNNGVVDYACRQAGTITSLQPGIGTTTACNTDVRLHAVGGGGEGFYAVVVKISPLGRIQQWEIVNHGTGYTSDPFLQIESHPSCTCNAKAGSTVGAFNDCVSFLRARDAELTAQPALGAILEATTGTRVILTGLENGTMPFRHDAVPIYAIGSPSISTGETQSCGVLKNGTAVCFGKSEQTFTKADVQTWVCGYEARYYRFTPLRTRGGGETVQLAEIEFYARNSDVKLVPVGASNPGGINPPGLSEEKATTAASDGDVETRWATLNKKPLQLDFGSQVIIERYRWMTASGSAPSDPVQWKIEASNQPLESESWVTIHEVSSLWHGEYTVGTGKTSRGSVYFLRNEWTRFWAGTCSMPEYQLWRSISVHAFHGCGINNAGIGYCWGHNSFKQLTFPDSPCSCEQKYNTYCSCTSANYLSTVYRKVKLNAGPGQCSDDRCYNTYADGTCEEKECRFIYSAEQCSLAGKALQLIPQDARVMNPGNSPFNPKGCYVLSNSQASSRVRFNRNNQSSDCTENENCVCQDCPSFSFIHYSDNAYCGGTFDSEEKTRQNELVGAKSVQACKEACGMDDTCDFFTFYPEKTSVACSPCCFKKDSECPLINPNSVIPKVGDVNPSSTWSYLSCGYLHTCGVTMAGSLKCWGFNRDEQASPPAVLATRKWRFVTSGKFHSCGILDDLTAHCWGANDKVLDTGQIAPLPGLGSFKWRALSCGVWHTCGITQGGDLHCWGCGGIDSLGRTRGISPTGEDVNKGQCDTSKVKSPGVLWDMISAAEFHSCGVTSTGEAHCWGCKCNPTACPAWNSSDIDLGQCDVPSGHQWSQIQAGRRHTCGLTIHGELLCWGCILNVTKPFFSKSGGVEFQNASLARTFDLGQCHPQKGFKTWMNSAAFSAKAQWTNRTDRGLELQVRSNTIVGADYFFGFPIQNPPQIQPHANTAVFTEGLALPSTDFQHSSPAVYGGLAVTDCQEGTSSNEDGECVPCVAGTYALDCGVEACTPCMPGQYSVAGSTRCRLCGVGRYSASYGSQNCSACPSGTKGPITGGTSIYDACVQCKAGKYTQTYHIWDEYGESWTDMGATTCIDCPRGYYCPGGSDKIRCGPRTYNGNSGANESAQCLECPHGLRCNGLWPRNVCKTPDGTGFDNGSVFTEIESCERACFSIEMEGGRGKCISVQGQNNGCAEGYDGKICHRCSDGYYPEFLEFQCKKCPSVWYQAWLLLTYSGCVLGIPLICDLTKVDSRISVYFRIMLMFFQNQDLSLSVNVRWPTSMITFVRALRIMNWDLMFTNPQCWFGNTDSMWQLVFLVEICFPLGSLALIWLLAAAFELHGKWTERISRSFWRLVGFFCLWYSIPFVGSCLRTVECSCVPDGYEMHRPSWDNCSFTGIFGSEPGRSVLTNNPFIVCHGESHWRQYTGAFGALLWVFIGIPMGLFFLPDMEPSIWNPFPVEKRSVRAKGLMKVVNIGVAKDQSSGISKSPGTGIMQFLSDSIREMQELITMGGEHISTLNELKDNASKSGRQKEKSKIARSIVNVEKQVQVCHERTALLEMTMNIMQDSLRHVPDSDVAKARQLSAIQTTEVSYRSGLLNFVEPVHIQRQRTKEMRWVLTDAPWSVKNKRGESFIFSAPPIVLWRHLQSLLQKNMKTLDVIRKNALKALFLLCTILAALPALAFTFLYSFWKGASMLMPKRFSPYQNVYFMWAKYGHVGEFKGEIRRVQPRYAQNEVIDNDQEVRGCVALLWRAHGEQHESTLYKVRRVQASGAIGVIVVNETNWSFTPRIVAENYATFQAIDIPVMGIRACDVHMIADGSIATFHYLRDYPRIFGLKRLKAFMTLVSMQTLVENYWPEMQWFEGVVWVRRGALVLMKYLLIRTPEIQACCILAVNFVYFCYTLFRPFRLEDFNRMECISAISCLMSSMFVVAVTVMYGKNSEGIPGLELNGSAGEFEDLGRRYVFYVLSMTNVILLIVVGVFLAQPVVSLSSHYILLWITNWLRPPLQPPTAKPKEDTSLPPDIDKVCYSMLHAIEEHSRVLAHHSHVRGAIDVAYGVLQEQEDVIARHAFNQMRALRQKPWTFVVGRGASGIHTDKEVYCFRHHFGGMVVEIPSHSAGDIRMKNSAEGQILSCSGDGILFKRDSFFSPLLIQRLEAISDRINRRERPILISKSGLEDDRQCGGKYKAPITRWRSFARAHKARSNVDDEREALQWLCEKCNLQNVIEDHRCSRCLSHRAQEKAVWRKDDDDEYQQADDVAAAYSLGEEAPKGASGLSWQNVGESKPADGEELQNTELAMALESTSTFQSWEWDSFGIQGLRLDHYIRSGPCYFKPAEEDSEFVPVDALYCPSRFGRWKSFCHNPDLVVAHRMKGIEVYFTRTSAVIMSCQDRAVILREGSQEAETVPLPVAREFLNSSSVVLPGGSALRAVETSLQVLSRRKKLPQWQLPPAAGAVVDVSPPVSALAAIHLTLDAFPEEVHSQARDPRTMDVNNLAPSISSGSDETIISPEKVEIDLDDFKLLGQKWRNVGMAQPKRGKELTNSRLAEALMAKTEFSLEEWDEFCIESLRVDHFIKSGSFFFMPSAGMLRNSAFIHWKRPMPISLRKEANLDLGTAEDFP